MKFTMIKLTIATHFNEILGGVIALAVGILAPAIETLLFAGFMIFCDTVTGVWAAKCRGEEIHSNKMKRVLAKLLLYPMAITVASYCQRILPQVPFITGAGTLLIVIEGKSLLENLNDILGFDFLKIVKIFITEGRPGVLRFFADKDKTDVN